MLKYSSLFFVSLVLNSLLLFVLRISNLGNELLFEQIIFSSVLGTLGLCLVCYLRGQKNLSTLLPVFICAVCISSIIQTSTILNIDRSRSFYVLAWTGKNLISIDKNDYNLSGVQSDESLGHTGIEIRINEQISRKLIARDRNRLYLTKSGQIYLKVAQKLSDLYRLDYWKRNNH